MDTAAVIVSVLAIGVALAIGGFAVWLQWKMYQASSEQYTKGIEILSNLRGVALELRETQQEQFSKVLDAALKSDTVDAAEVVDQRVAELERRLEEQSPGADIDDLKAAVADLRDKTLILEKSAKGTFRRRDWPPDYDGGFQTRREFSIQEQAKFDRATEDAEEGRGVQET